MQHESKSWVLPMMHIYAVRSNHSNLDSWRSGIVRARVAAVRRGGRIDAALGASQTDLRIMWRPLLVIRVSQLVSRAAGHR